MAQRGIRPNPQNSGTNVPRRPGGLDFIGDWANSALYFETADDLNNNRQQTPMGNQSGGAPTVPDLPPPGQNRH